MVVGLWRQNCDSGVVPSEAVAVELQMICPVV